MFSLILIIHVLVCACLIGIILIQQGKGGGLLESFSGVESMFGTKTNVFLTRATTVLATMFIITCLFLTILSKNKSKSVLERIKVTTPAVTTQPSVNQTAIPQAPIKEVTPKITTQTIPAASESGQNQTAAP
ncbi:MAG: preprotein translocase subunit SecG [Candidatus Omnitrophica bacterium]|nr:preprotein translocase subunit SecG [Candidatus Omnitrophota bacterium]